MAFDYEQALAQNEQPIRAWAANQMAIKMANLQHRQGLDTLTAQNEFERQRMAQQEQFQSDEQKKAFAQQESILNRQRLLGMADAAVNEGAKGFDDAGNPLPLNEIQNNIKGVRTQKATQQYNFFKSQTDSNASAIKDLTDKMTEVSQKTINDATLEQKKVAAQAILADPISLKIQPDQKQQLQDDITAGKDPTEAIQAIYKTMAAHYTPKLVPWGDTKAQAQGFASQFYQGYLTNLGGIVAPATQTTLAIYSKNLSDLMAKSQIDEKNLVNHIQGSAQYLPDDVTKAFFAPRDEKQVAPPVNPNDAFKTGGSGSVSPYGQYGGSNDNPRPLPPPPAPSQTASSPPPPPSIDNTDEDTSDIGLVPAMMNTVTRNPAGVPPMGGVAGMGLTMPNYTSPPTAPLMNPGSWGKGIFGGSLNYSAPSNLDVYKGTQTAKAKLLSGAPPSQDEIQMAQQLAASKYQGNPQRWAQTLQDYQAGKPYAAKAINKLVTELRGGPPAMPDTGTMPPVPGAQPSLTPAMASQ